MKTERGFILPVTFGLILVAAAIVAASLSYVAHTTRMTRYHLAKSRCRLAAISGIEYAKTAIQAGFDAHTGGGNAISVKVDTKSGVAYNWFDTVSADGRTIGDTDQVTLVAATNIDGCVVYPAVGRKVEHTANVSLAYVPVVATAVYTAPDGLRATSTIQEYVLFATGQSHVFDYAYFVNNYGWMSGSGIVINGDMRANGNVSLSGSVVNGYVYAAVNDLLGVDGAVSLSNSPKIYNASKYRSSVTNRARPTNPPSDSYDGTWAGGYEAPSSSTTITKNLVSTTGDYIISEGEDALPMPYVSNMKDYVEYAIEEGGRLTYPTTTYTDASGTTRTLAGGTVSAHYSGAGPSGDATLADNGALVLVGTQSNPIVISGPVVVDNDVIIKGYVSGQGTIYSGRNIHIVGSIQYVNAPSWSHPDSDPESTREKNQSADLLGLVAKGNIVVGNETTTSWHNSIDKYISATGGTFQKHYCDDYDIEIGYPDSSTLFTAGYNVTEVTGSKLKVVETEVGTGTYTETQVPVYDRRGRVIGYTTQRVENTELVTENQSIRKYCDTVCADSVINSLSTAVGQIDAVLYNNHGIFGTIGSGSGAFNLNGSIVCRDEGLVSTAGSGINFNWDIRLRQDSAEAVDDLGLPVGPQDPYTVTWQEVNDSVNPAYKE